MNKFFAVGFCVVLTLPGCKPEKPLVEVPMTKAMTGQAAPCEQLVWGGFPRSLNPPKEKTTSFVCRDFYALNFNVVRGTSDWVVEKLLSEDLNKPDAKLVGSEVRPDGEIPKSRQTTTSDYRGIGYGKGFFAAPDNFRYSEIAYSYSFYLTNIYPQHPDQEATIKLLEDWIRSEAKKRKEIYIISGPVYQDGNGLGWVGQSDKPSANGDAARKGKVQVPSSVFKILFSPSTKKAIAFEIPNAPVSTSLGSYLVPIAVLERKTGLIFFGDLPVAEQQSIKSGTLSSW